jgi:hypothetical protein
VGNLKRKLDSEPAHSPGSQLAKPPNPRLQGNGDWRLCSVGGKLGDELEDDDGDGGGSGGVKESCEGWDGEHGREECGDVCDGLWRWRGELIPLYSSYCLSYGSFFLLHL